eukprot:1747796-Pleurochrysis_carterae.AAC.2
MDVGEMGARREALESSMRRANTLLATLLLKAVQTMRVERRCYVGGTWEEGVKSTRMACRRASPRTGVGRGERVEGRTRGALRHAEESRAEGGLRLRRARASAAVEARAVLDQERRPDRAEEDVVHHACAHAAHTEARAAASTLPPFLSTPPPLSP